MKDEGGTRIADNAPLPAARCQHPQYLDRYTQAPSAEPVAGDRFIRLLYGKLPRFAPGLLRALASAVMSRVLAYFVFYAPWIRGDARGFARANGIDLDDLPGDASLLKTRRDVFLRQIDYESRRPLPEDRQVAVSPADSKLSRGKLEKATSFSIKNRFFDLSELLGGSREKCELFLGGEYFIFRLAPPDYHWFHAPVAGIVEEVFLLDGLYYSVNPIALRSVGHVLSKNARQVMIIDSDAPGGSGLGRVALIAVAAQVIGGIAMSYRDPAYENPRAPRAGLFVKRGRPLGFFYPGSSTVVLLFQKGRVDPAPDLVQPGGGTLSHRDRELFGNATPEVALRVRDVIAYRKGALPKDEIPIGEGRRLVREGKIWRVQPLTRPSE